MWVIIATLEGYFNGYSADNAEGAASGRNGNFGEREVVVVSYVGSNT